MSAHYPYYYETWFVVLMLLLFFPAGFLLMWRGNKFGRISRLFITAAGLSLLYPFVRKMKKLILS